jgi:hypothetical protein
MSTACGQIAECLCDHTKLQGEILRFQSLFYSPHNVSSELILFQFPATMSTNPLVLAPAVCSNWKKMVIDMERPSPVM